MTHVSGDNVGIRIDSTTVCRRHDSRTPLTELGLPSRLADRIDPDRIDGVNVTFVAAGIFSSSRVSSGRHVKAAPASATINCSFLQCSFGQITKIGKDIVNSSESNHIDVDFFSKTALNVNFWFFLIC